MLRDRRRAPNPNPDPQPLTLTLTLTTKPDPDPNPNPDPNPDQAPHGSLSLRGATICTDDFATGQAFSIIIESPTRGKDGPLFLSALSLRDRDAWTAAFTHVDRCVYRAAIEEYSVDLE